MIAASYSKWPATTGLKCGLAFLLYVAVFSSAVAQPIRGDLIPLPEFEDKNLSMEHFTTQVQRVGFTVFIDCFDIEGWDAELNVAELTKGGRSNSGFYEIVREANVFEIFPKEEKERSEFLSKTIGVYQIENATLYDSVEMLGKDSDVSLSLNGDSLKYHEQVRLNLNLKNKTVRQILLEIAAACQSKHVSLSPMREVGGDRKKVGPVLVSFF